METMVLIIGIGCLAVALLGSIKTNANLNRELKKYTEQPPNGPDWRRWNKRVLEYYSSQYRCHVVCWIQYNLLLQQCAEKEVYRDYPGLPAEEIPKRIKEAKINLWRNIEIEGHKYAHGMAKFNNYVITINGPEFPELYMTDEERKRRGYKGDWFAKEWDIEDSGQH